MEAVTIVTPQGGEIWGAKHTVAWLSLGQGLTYDIEFSGNDGGTWKVVASKVIGTSYAYDFSDESESNLCLIRIRAHNGWTYGPYGYSNKFTIQHNRPPTKPTNLSPTSVVADRTQVIRINWKHNSPYTETQQSKYDLSYSLDEGVTWTTISRVTTEEFHYFSANFFMGKVYWKVRTYDQYSLASPWSDQAVFTASDPTDAPLILSPIETIPVIRPIVSWSAIDQTAYQVQVVDKNLSIVWDSGEVISNAQSVQIGADLGNNETYTFKARVKGTLWTEWATSTQLVLYSTPPQPSVAVTPGNGYIEIKVNNPVPQDPEPEVLYNDIFRRENSEWIRVGTNVLSNGKFHDYNVASGVTYEYKARAQGSNNSFIESNVVGASVSLRGIWLHSVNDNTLVNVPYNRDIRATWKPTRTLNSFAGRRFPVADFGENEELSYAVIITTVDEEDKTWFPRLQELIKRKEILCIRDYRGRKVFGVAEELDETQLYIGNEIPLRIDAVDYSEVV